MSLRVRRGISSLRSRGLFGRVQSALAYGQERFGFRLVHFSVQRDHLHLIAEASDRRALSRGMQGLTIRVARAVNRQLGRSGSVFAERYHARALRTPRAVHFALRYVLLKCAQARTQRARGARRLCRRVLFWALVRRFRAAALACGGRACRAAFGLSRARSLEAPVVAARTWLLLVGYRRAGPMDMDDAPLR